MVLEINSVSSLGGGNSKNVDADAIIPTLQQIFEALPIQEVRLTTGEEAGGLPSFEMSDASLGTISINFGEGFSVRKGNNGFYVMPNGTPGFNGNALSAWQSVLGVTPWLYPIEADTFITQTAQVNDVTSMAPSTNYYPCFFIYDDIDVVNDEVVMDRYGSQAMRSVSTPIEHPNTWIQAPCLGFFNTSMTTPSYSTFIYDAKDFKNAQENPYDIPSNVKAVMLNMASTVSKDLVGNIVSNTNAYRIVSIT